ncbi:MAG: transketolase [Saprospirales bacterium]|nr:transketolase [Saprospirales bacterium]
MLENPLAKPSGLKKEEAYIQEVIHDYRVCCISREASLLARKEVLTGKAKFGIIGDGKEVPQVALAKAFRKGDWRSGYYRDQTLLFALGLCSVEDFFAQLYADPDNDPFSGGRQMNSHFASPSIDPEGNWTNHTDSFNISSDMSPTAGQMARALGLALASQKYRNIPGLHSENPFSHQGNEVCFCTIGDASTSEGVFWEAMNAAAVQQVPMAISVWDDGYGISVPIDYQTVKKSISKALAGFQLDENGEGMDIYTCKGWDYTALCELYEKGLAKVRQTHIPALFHIQELTQPQGHSTSGSHERYKSPQRLQWERDHDCILKMREWMIREGLAGASQLDELEKEAKIYVRQCRDKAWKAYMEPVQQAVHYLDGLYGKMDFPEVAHLHKELKNLLNPLFFEVVQNARRVVFATLGEQHPALDELKRWLVEAGQKASNRYETHLYSSSPRSALRIPVVPPVFNENSPHKNGYEVLNAFFDFAFSKYPEFLAFGEDVGKIGDVNQGFSGLQAKYGEERLFDTGIREWTIMGQAIGMAMRGLRPLAEIQYLDYLIYGLEPLSDDLATLRYRTNGIQQAPAIIRTRGHRLEGIWHAGSPIGMLLGALRGMYVCAPRNMVQAVGMYNTLLQSDDPGLVIECLNGYRLKETLPDNMGEYTVPLGISEILQEGSDLTLVTYGSSIRIAQAGIELLKKAGISVELIDVQTLLPFDLHQSILKSLRKTGRIVFMDEDVPGGGTAYMLREVLEVQGGYRYLDSQPVTLTAKAHRPPFGSDGDYFSKPNPEDVFETIYNLMREAEPKRFPEL